MKYNGSDLMVFANIGGKFVSIALAKNHTLDISMNTVDTSTKDNGNGIWQENEAGLLSWTLQTENLVGDSSEQGCSINDLAKMIISRQKVELVFALQGDMPDYLTKLDTEFKVPVGGWTPDKENYFKGSAYITAFNMGAQNGEKATASATFTGSGQLLMFGNGIGTAAPKVATASTQGNKVATVAGSAETATLKK